MQATVRVQGKIEDGLMPAEKIVSVENADGQIEEVSVSTSSISENRLLAFEIGRHEGRVLVELPRESASGRWRIWVSENAVA